LTLLRQWFDFHFNDNIMPVRNAKAEDEAKILNLVHQLGYENVALDELRMKMNLYGNDSHLLLVFEENNRVIGFIALDVMQLFHIHGKTGKITSLCIDIKSRGKGIGKALVAEAEKFFRECKCTRIEVTSNQRREDAHSFYVALGYKQTSLKFVRELLE
jgi:ribosomal protein S18 acetylase RimI-like enzyme